MCRIVKRRGGKEIVPLQLLKQDRKIIILRFPKTIKIKLDLNYKNQKAKYCTRKTEQ